MLKDKVYFNKSFLISAAKLFIMQILFLILSICFTGSGHGIYIQFPLFYSWLLLPLSFLNISQLEINSIMGKLLMIYTISIPIIFFILSVILLLTIWYKKIKKEFYIWLLILMHLVGSVVVIIMHKINTNSFSPFFLFPSSSIAGVIAIILLITIFFFFWRIFFKFFKEKNLEI